MDFKGEIKTNYLHLQVEPIDHLLLLVTTHTFYSLLQLWLQQFILTLFLKKETAENTVNGKSISHLSWFFHESHRLVLSGSNEKKNDSNTQAR